MAGREDLRSMQDAWRAYLDLALGLTETSRKRATKVAKKLVGRGGATAEQLQTMAEELINTSMANREAITRLVRFELDRALGRVGLATQDEVSELTTRVRELEHELSVAKAAAAAPAPTGPVAVPASPTGPVKSVRKVAKKTVAKKAAAKKATPAETAAPTAAAAGGRTGTRKAGAGDTVVKVTPSRVVAKKTGSATPDVPPAAARKAAVKKTATRRATPGPVGEQPGEQ